MTFPFVPPDKIRRYLLNPLHPTGRFKAEFFTRLGFSLAESELLSIALQAHSQTAILAKTEITPDGDVKLIFECTITVPTGTNPCIRSVWIKQTDDDRLRLITAYPVRS